MGAYLLNGFHTFDGTDVQVVEAFTSINKKRPRKLAIGIQGVVDHVDGDGDASIIFEGIDVNQWVKRDDFSKLRCSSQQSGIFGELEPLEDELEQRVLAFGGRILTRSAPSGPFAPRSGPSSGSCWSNTPDAQARMDTDGSAVGKMSTASSAEIQKLLQDRGSCSLACVGAPPL